MDNEVWAGLIGQGRLLEEVAVVDHTGDFDDTFELDFAPFSADVRGFECLGEVLSFFIELDFRFFEDLDMLFKGGVVLEAGFFDRFEVIFNFLDGGFEV